MQIFQVVNLNGKGQDLTVDWISRTLYVVEIFSSGESSILQFNMDMGDYSILLTRNTSIGSIVANPYNR